MYNPLQVNRVWEACLELAIEGYNAGSLGIAAVVVDPRGTIVSSGRNQLMDNLESCNAIRMTSIAHAEINAVNNIPAENQQKKGMTLYTTVEPCPMCLGAIVMSRIRKIIIGSADPYAGSTELLQKGEYLKNKGVKVKFESGKIEELFFMLHYLSIRR